MIFRPSRNRCIDIIANVPAMRRTAAICALGATVALAGCAVNALSQKAPEKTAQERARIAATTALNQGIDLYNRGEYQAAIKQLGNANEAGAADKDLQLEAHKYMAFSYCVTGRPAPCRQEFEKALKIDPRFDLTQGEKGHPLWGPVFERIKKNK